LWLFFAVYGVFFNHKTRKKATKNLKKCSIKIFYITFFRLEKNPKNGAFFSKKNAEKR